MSGASATRSGGYTLATHANSHSPGGYDALGVGNLPLGLVDSLGQTVPQEGILALTDGPFTVVNSTTFRINAGSAWINGDNVSDVGAGRYYITWAQTDITVPLPLDANDRIDMIVVQASGKHGSVGTVTRIAGTAGQASQVTLDNRLGAAALPGAALHMFDIISDNVTGVTTSIRDRRPWAKGEMTFAVNGTSLAIYSDLDGDVDEGYEIELRGTADAGAADRILSLRPNGIASFSVSLNGGWQHYQGDTNGISAITAAGGIGYFLAKFYNGSGVNHFWGKGSFAAKTVAVGAGRPYQADVTSKRGVGNFVERWVSLGSWSDNTTKVTSLVLDFGGVPFLGTVVVRKWRR